MLASVTAGGGTWCSVALVWFAARLSTQAAGRDASYGRQARKGLTRDVFRRASLAELAVQYTVLMGDRRRSGWVRQHLALVPRRPSGPPSMWSGSVHVNP